MTLTGRVVELESGKAFTDGVPRATIRITEAGAAFHNKIAVPNVDGMKLDDEVHVLLQVQPPVQEEQNV